MHALLRRPYNILEILRVDHEQRLAALVGEAAEVQPAARSSSSVRSDAASTRSPGTSIGIPGG